ncbi:MAG: threonine-phosphate decarboxylase CobD [Candidatus Binatia bacterium]
MLRKTKVKRKSAESGFETLGAEPLTHGGNVYAFARALGVEPEDVLDFSASINPLGLPQGARQAYRRALQKVIHYPEPYAETLRQALGEHHGIAPTSVLVGNGSTQLIYLIARKFSLRHVLLVSPLFSEHIAALRTNGARVSYWKLRPPSFTLDLEALKRTLWQKQPNALVLTNPNSPTGVLLGGEQVDELIQLCRRTRTRLIVDETFIDWVEEESVKQLAVRDANVVVLRSLTKFFALPGLRVGYAIASPEVIQRLWSRIEPWSVNVVAQEVGKACLQDRRFSERSRAFMKKERAWLHAELGAISGLQVFPSAANFFLVQIRSSQMTAVRLAELLAQKRLLIRVCDNFVGLGKQFFRIAVRTRAENLRLVDALRAAFIRSGK